jgi:dipeptidyl-peptidase-3
MAEKKPFMDVKSRVHHLSFSEPWAFLTPTERNYAYYMSKASWAGAKMVFHQMSYESPALFSLFQSFFHNKDFESLRKAALDHVTEEDWKNFITYVAGFYGNMSNYISFGFKKFVPDVSPANFKKIMWSRHDSDYEKVRDEVWELVEPEIFDAGNPYTSLGFPHENAVTAYLSRNMGPEDLTLVREFCHSEKLSFLNTRAFKTSENEYEVTVGSINTDKSKSVEFKGKSFKITYGEFAPYLSETVDYLQKALPYVANSTQKEMLEFYIESFTTGDIDAHKNS